jgi:F0F1-type ATP synthase assembly protein I
MVKNKNKPDVTKNRADNPEKEFLGAALSMSWQLAVVVLVPVIGGFELDKKLGTLPGLTMAGFVLAMVGLSLVVWRQLQRFQPPASKQAKGRKP